MVTFARWLALLIPRSPDKLEGYTSIGTPSWAKSIRFVWHLVDRHLHPGGIEPLELPSFSTHIPIAEEWDGPVAFAHDHAVVDHGVSACWCRKACVNGHIDLAQRVLILAVEIAAFGRLADAIEAVDLEVWRQRQAGFERVDPFPVIVLVQLHFGAGLCKAVRVVFANHLLVPWIAVFEQILDTPLDSEVGRGMSRIALPKVYEISVAEVLAWRVIGC